MTCCAWLLWDWTGQWIVWCCENRLVLSDDVVRLSAFRWASCIFASLSQWTGFFTHRYYCFCSMPRVTSLQRLVHFLAKLEVRSTSHNAVWCLINLPLLPSHLSLARAKLLQLSLRKMLQLNRWRVSHLLFALVLLLSLDIDTLSESLLSALASVLSEIEKAFRGVSRSFTSHWLWALFLFLYRRLRLCIRQVDCEVILRVTSLSVV